MKRKFRPGRKPKFDYVSRKGAAKVDRLARRLLVDLEGLGCWLYKQALTGSTYLKFAEACMGSVRVADHPGKSEYRYRWNLDVTMTGCRSIVDRGVTRHFYGPDSYDQMLHDIRQFHVNLVAQEVHYG